MVGNFPIRLGVGLGVFHAKSTMWAGHALVIHSTPLWILAEFGLLGGAGFGWTFFLLARVRSGTGVAFCRQ